MLRRFVLIMLMVMLGFGNSRLALAENCEVSLDHLQTALGSLLMMAHQAGAVVPNDQEPEIEVRRLAKSYADAKLSLINAKTNCANNPKALDMIHARERDLDKIGATLSVEKPR